MAVSLTRDEIKERFSEQEDEFRRVLVKGLRYELPITIDSFNTLADFFTDVLEAYLDVVFGVSK